MSKKEITMDWETYQSEINKNEEAVILIKQEIKDILDCTSRLINPMLSHNTNSRSEDVAKIMRYIRKYEMI